MCWMSWKSITLSDWDSMKYKIIAKCDPYNASKHYHGQKVVKYDGTTPVAWVVAECEEFEPLKEMLRKWCLEECGGYEEWDRDVVTERVHQYCLEGLFEAAEDMLAEYIKFGDGIYAENGVQVMAKGAESYSYDVMTYVIEEE